MVIEENVVNTWVEGDIHSGKLQIKAKSEAGNFCCGKKTPFENKSVRFDSISIVAGLLSFEILLF